MSDTDYREPKYYTSDQMEFSIKNRMQRHRKPRQGIICRNNELHFTMLWLYLKNCEKKTVSNPGCDQINPI
jgi:hypothetical protein